MSTIKRILPTILMLLSTLSLIGFLLWWNLGEYNREKKNLKKELSLHLESAINEIQQKQFNKFIRRFDVKVTGTTEKSSVILDSLSNNVKGSISNYSKLRSNKINRFTPDSASDIFIWIDSLDINESFPKLQLDSSKTPIVRYFAHTDTVNDYRFPSKVTGLDLFTWEKVNTQSEEVKKALEVMRAKLIENNLPQNFALQNDTLKASNQDLVIEYNTSSFYSQPELIYFQEYESYLLSKIGSSILFSILLLVLVLISFTVLFKSWNKQRQIVEMKNDFISNITHELKTPISTVSVAIEAIRKYGVLEDRQKTEEYLEISNNELGRLSLLVEKVLRTTLFEGKEGFLNPQLIDFNVLVKETIQTMKMYFEEKQVELTSDIAEQKLMTVGDKIHLTNVIYNLIENAIKYSKDPIKVHVVSKKEGNEIFLSIKDNGIGIANEHQKHVFTKFYRVPNNNRHNVKGHGLGLSYVKQVIDELGGKIELKSNREEGTIFTIVLKAINDE